MSRNPFWPLFAESPKDEISFGPDNRGKRPELEAIIGHSLTAWPQAEAEMGLFFGQLLEMPNSALVAVFQTLRRSTNQRAAIATAAESILDRSEDKELVHALLKVQKSIESERNALAHGHFGVYDAYPDILLWMTTETYIDYKTHAHLLPFAIMTAEDKKYYISRIYYYRKDDLIKTLENIDYLSGMWPEAINWLRSLHSSSGEREERYRQLCCQSRIARALDSLRQKNNRAIPPQSPLPAASE